MVDERRPGRRRGAKVAWAHRPDGFARVALIVQQVPIYHVWHGKGLQVRTTSDPMS
jgi:hypothetical protein